VSRRAAQHYAEEPGEHFVKIPATVANKLPTPDICGIDARLSRIGSRRWSGKCIAKWDMHRLK
jgi:hypothetical protein